jgi:hypothetical protein
MRPLTLFAAPQSARRTFSSRLHLTWSEMLLPAHHKDHVLDDSVVELFLRSGVDGMRQVDTCDNGADVLLDLRNLHSLGGTLDAAALMIWLLISCPAD